MDNEDKVRENRLRRMAARQGLFIIKSRRRDPSAIDYGAYWIADAYTNTLETSELGFNLDEVEEFLTQ
jgi:hypothetical protein